MPLVTTTEMFKKAYEGGYAIGAFNVNNMEIIQGITEAAAEERAPLILQVSAGARKYAKHIYLTKLVEAAIADTDLPIALHLDHGADFDICKACVDGGFSSVMIDGSKYSFEENIALTRKVVEYAHAHGVVVEGELGTLAGIEDDVHVKADDALFTRPEEVEEFVTRTGVDSLAIAIGTSHGAYKFKPGQKPQLRFDILEEVGRRSTADKAAQEKNRALLDLERSSAQLEQKKMAAEMEERQIVEKLWDSYELSRTEAEKVRQPVESFAKAGRQVSELRRSMSALGTPNLGAIEEYKRVSERYTFLSEQRDDVQKSKDEILKIIADITAQMEEIFVREIQEIDEAFRQIFVELFGGGKASLSLEDMNDVLNCGIDIRIQPPGKAVSNISLLSGGEKAFVAIALYFAIMRVRPTPFCIMDEIESALDEENVARYAAYMRRMCGKTQFIAITHRRGTMEEADQLYGVTMQEKGVSTVLAMDMEEALQTIR